MPNRDDAQMNVFFLFHQTVREAALAINAAMRRLLPDILDDLARSKNKNLIVIILSCESAADIVAIMPPVPSLQNAVRQVR